MRENRVHMALSVLLVLVVMALVPIVRFVRASNAQLFSATTVGGIITSDTNWTEANSPYVVTSSVLVSQGITLTIEPGVVVKFDSLKGLQIDGQLIARGTEDKRIIFTSMKDDTVGGDSNGDGNLTSPVPGDWAYVFFTDPSVDAAFDVDGKYVSGSILEHCKVIYGGSGGTEGEMRIDLSAPFLNNTIISNSFNRGIYVSQGTPKIVNSSVNHNGQEGIYINDYQIGNEATIVGNTITNNVEHGIYAYLCSGTGIISDNTIADNGGAGVSVGGYCGFTITGNIIRSNSRGGIIVYGPSVTITNNIVTYNSQGYYYYMGSNGCVYVYGYGGYQTYQVITNNVMAYNTASGGAALYLSSFSNYSTLTVSDNSIIANTATSDSIVHIDGDTSSLDTFTYNLLTQNARLGNSTVPSSLAVNGLPIVNCNNFFNNFYSCEINNTNGVGPSNVNATNNWWGTSNETEIEAKIYDWSDDITKGIVDYTPYSTSVRTDVPISPPLNLTLTPGAANFTLTWKPNPEPDLAGYKIYYDTDSGYPYRYSIDVGNVTTYTLTGLPPNAIFFTVTAYDTDADGTNDLFEGHESWFAYEAIADYSPPTIETPSRIPAGDVQSYESVKVLVNVTDAESGVKNVTLLYTTDNGTTWTSLPMNCSLSANLYNATIPGQWYGATVKYKIVASDYAGNSVTKDGTDPHCVYQVSQGYIAEFPSLMIAPLFMVITLLAVAAHKRERLKPETKRK